MLLLAGRRSGDAHNRVPKKKRLNAEPCHHAVTTNQEKDRTYGRVASVSYTSSCHNFEHTSIVLGALPPRRHHNFKRIELGSVREEHIFFFSPLHFEEIKYILATQPSPKKKKISVARVPWSSLTRRVHHNHHHHHHYHQVPHVKSTRQSVAMANNAAQETSKRTPTVEQKQQQQHHPTKKQRQQQQQDGGRPDNNNNNSNNNMPPRRLYWVGNPLFALTPVLLSSSSIPSSSTSTSSSSTPSSTSTKGTHDQPRQLPPLPPASLPFASSSSVHKNHHNQNEKNGGYQAERQEEQQEEEEKKRKEKSLWDHRGEKMRRTSLGSEMGKNRENGGGGGGTAAATATARKDVKM